jgi:hypothetical protein
MLPPQLVRFLANSTLEDSTENQEMGVGCGGASDGIAASGTCWMQAARDPPVDISLASKRDKFYRGTPCPPRLRAFSNLCCLEYELNNQWRLR